MKRIILLIFLLQSIITQAQSEGITYQAVIYNPAGEQLPGVNNPYAPLLNQSVCLRFNLISSNGLLEYQEFIQTTTDSFGMVNLLIGMNTPTGEGAVNDFSEIQWVTDSKSLIVELDISGDCQNFEEISNQPLNYVPFAYYAKNSDADAAVATLQTDVDQNEADADTAIATNTTSIATTQADVDANETTAANATAAVQADVDQNESDADTAIAALQADVDQNESDSDSADTTMQADIDQNESDADAAIAANTTSINNLIGGNSAFTSINVDGGSIDGTTIGATTVSTGAFTTLSSSGATSLATGSGAVNVASSGAMTTVKGTLNVDEAVTLDSTLDVTGATNINDTTASTSTTTGALIVDGGVGIAQNLNVGGTIDVTGATNINDTTFSTSTTTGALIVDGGVGIAQNLNVGRNLDVTGLSILSSTLDVTGDTSVSTFDSSGATSLATGGGVVNVASTGVMTTVKGTLNVDEAVTLDTTLDVTGDTSVSTFDSSGATSIATGGGVVNIASDGVMTTVEGTLNVDEAVTLDSTLDVNGNVTSSGGSISGFDAALNDQTSTSYTLQSSDNGKVVTLNNASAITLTIPSSLGDGFNCLIVQKGDGQISLTASGTTLINRQSHSKTAGKYAVLSIVNIGSETIIVAGDTGS